MRPLALLAAVLLSGTATTAADFKDVDPNVFPKDDPRAKNLPKMMWADATKRMKEANLRESKAFADVTTKAQWEAYRDVRIQKLKESLGTFPEVPKEMNVKVTRTLEGDGFAIQCIVYESRPGFWVSANLYLPKANADRKVGGDAATKMPGIIISHSHHTSKTHGELQDMGMTWARSGVAVLIPDHLGHGERRQHDFATEKDYDKPFRVSRQDYYFRYNTNLQLSAAGESLMGWMVWDLMRGVDVLLTQKNIDNKRIIMLGAVAGGGDAAGVTAALDKRIACVVPFNFGGWQPESTPLENPDRDAPWFGEGYWESTRGLKNGARDGFAHYVIVGAVAPRPVIYAHEFAWDAKLDPAWPRLQKIFGFYDAKDKLVSIHGKGSVKGAAGPDNTHCNHIGAIHRKGIYPALKEWFGMPIPEEYSKRRPAEELMCWTDKAKKNTPWNSHFSRSADTWQWDDPSLSPSEWKRSRQKNNDKPGGGRSGQYCSATSTRSPTRSRSREKAKRSQGKLQRFALEVEEGIIVPFFLISPKEAKEKAPVVLMVAQGGKSKFLKERGAVIEAFLKTGVVVCLVDVRGTGETSPADGSPERTGARTSISQTNLILGQPVIGSQLRDLRTVIRWVQNRKELDGKRLAVWGDSFAKMNASDARFAVPLDAPDLPRYAEPGAAILAALTALFEDEVRTAYAGGGTSYADDDLWNSPYHYVPHDAIVPHAGFLGKTPDIRVWPRLNVDFWNSPVFDRKQDPLADVAKGIAAQLFWKEPPIVTRPVPWVWSIR